MPRKRRGKRFDPKKDRCYACESPATGDEHVPPKCFFPANLQGKSLTIVPSCDAHNAANSPDVEYVRNVLSIQYGSSPEAEVVTEKTYRSWDHSEKLFDATMKGAEIARVMDGEVTEETALFRVDLSRIKAVAASIAHALFYLEHGKAWLGEFQIFTTFHSKASLQGKPDGTEKIGRWFCARKYEERPALHPTVFRYMVHDSSELIYAMCFYDKLWIYARRVGKVISGLGTPMFVRL